jgi:hypothetical protein
MLLLPALQSPEPTVELARILLPLTAALGLSLFVERVIELLKNAVDLLPTTAAGRSLQKPALLGDAAETIKKLHEEAIARSGTEKASETALEQPRKRVQELEKKLASAPSQAVDAELEEARKALKAAIAEQRGLLELDERMPGETILVLKATDPDDGSTVRVFVIQLLALAAGIGAAHYADVRLFEALLGRNLLAGATGSMLTLSHSLDYLLTGLFIGGGSAPVHVLIRVITERKFAAPAEPVATETTAIATPEGVVVATQTVSVAPALAPASVIAPVPATATRAAAAPAIVASPATTLRPTDWVDIAYDGGVDRERLAGIHRREKGKNPTLVVYHHTAMHSRSTFEDVVRVIKNRKDSKGHNWVTGYNHVVVANGGSHAFCRWDRYGNHAAGFNRQSLGITLNGNFETTPGVPYGNADGRYGSPRPTDMQLEMAARVVTLWCYLYGIDPDFKNHIIPHKKVSPKTCPGNMFPYERFEKLVHTYHSAWAKTPEIKDRIEAFKLKPYLFA